MSATIESNTTRLLAKPGKHLTFLLGQEFYGLPVLKVREIIKLVNITPVPRMPGHVKGVVNLRGKIIPIIDLRLKFDMAPAANTDRTCIIVVQAADSAQITTTALGVVVDSVEEVLNISANEIEETPDFGTAVNIASLQGMAKINGKVVSLLDIDRVVGADRETTAAHPSPTTVTQSAPTSPTF
jgi:purine-binding chemotaxis protein CheW